MTFLLHQLLSESAAKYPNKEAIVFKDQRMTYSELERETNKLAYSLSEIGIERGERVGIHMSRCINSVVGAFGILKAGATYVPIDPMCPPSRLSYIINKCAIKCLLTSREKLTNIERGFPERSPIENILIMNSLDPGFRSPGNPKGVMISHLNSLTFINSVHDFFQITMDDRFSNICPLHFDMSVFDLFVAFKAGASVIIVPENVSIFPSQLAEFIEKNKISVWNSVPSALSLLANFKNLDNYDFSGLRLILFAGEVFPVKHLRRLQKTIPRARFYNIYGQTEANSSTYYWVEQVPSDDSALLPIGKPFPNFEVFALNEDRKRINKPGEKGELYVRASSVALGYWGDVEKTEECFVKNPLKPDLNERVYKTGDLVQLGSDGNFIFLGRKDHMIKSRGYRIEIGEIETVLCNHPEIMTAVVIPIPDELIGNRIAAVIVPLKKGTVGREDIIKHCAIRLPKYMIPELIEFRDSLMMTSSGKVDRQSYIELFREQFLQKIITPSPS
jgi:non-ribosomal peptide synthetase component F